jgi:hypothetical protein
VLVPACTRAAGRWCPPSRRPQWRNRRPRRTPRQSQGAATRWPRCSPRARCRRCCSPSPLEPHDVALLAIRGHVEPVLGDDVAHQGERHPTRVLLAGDEVPVGPVRYDDGRCSRVPSTKCVAVEASPPPLVIAVSAVRSWQSRAASHSIRGCSWPLFWRCRCSSEAAVRSTEC